MVPQWTYRYDRTARWDRFGRPDKMPEYATSAAFPTIWWWDAARAAKIGGRP
jgi:microcin C transport system substrate-binding protein